jgi:ABC-type Zn uptake system ZnuABC Zn-binding protein ZnuA
MIRTLKLMFIAALLLSACQSTPTPAKATVPILNVVAAETFLADIAQNVIGERAVVKSLMPIGVDPHSFEPTPQDVATVAESNVLIVNGSGFEGFLDELLQNAGGERAVIEASAGLTPRKPGSTENVDEPIDPHFWLDPNNAVKYVENIRDALQKIDPVAAVYYGANADKYIQQLTALDQAIRAQVSTIPENRRLIVTNHESFGYFADRYGFTVIGTIIPSVSTGSAPSAQQLVRLIDQIKATGASAIFLETGTNPQLAQQIASETGIKVVTELYSHSLSDARGPAPTYIDMIQTNVAAIVKALK